MPAPSAFFAEMLRAARELLAVRSPLDAELMISELLGTWWSQEPEPGRKSWTRRRRSDIEDVVGEGLINYAAEQASPAALALLSGIACLGAARQAVKAEQAALALMDHGVVIPAWASRAGAVQAAECYVTSDAFGDRDEVVCVFTYAGEDEHALVVVVDYNAGGMIKDGWVTSQVGKLLDYCKELGGPDGTGRTKLNQVSSPNARRLLESALAVTEATANPPVSKSFPAYHAFIRARIRTLPPSLSRTPQARPRQSGDADDMAASADAAHAGHAHTGNGHAAPALAGHARSGPVRTATSRSSAAVATAAPAIGPGACRRPTWRPDRRAMLAAEFLSSDEAEDLSDLEAASRCADHIVDYGCDQDFGRPLRVSPAKAETFLLDWLPRKVMLTAAEQHAMPHVLVAWSRWAGARSGLDIAAISKTLDSVFDSIAAFTKVYRDPASFGLEPALVARLLPDRDLEALPRRAFAFGVLEGNVRGIDLGALDPAKAEDRRTLLAADHDDPAHLATDEHLEAHVTLAERLWHGDPPELWEAAQRLLDLGLPRHEVVHMLINAITAAGQDDRAIRITLSDLPPENLTGRPGRHSH